MRSIFIALIGITVGLMAEWHSTIPVVDMRDYYNPDRKAVFVDQVGNALREVGFFAVVNPDIEMEVLDKAYDSVQGFFSLSLEEKRKCLNPELNGQRGYVESESAKGCAFKDFKEFLHIGRELSNERLAQLRYAKNVWPISYNLKDPTMALYDGLEEAGKPIAEAISLAMGQEKDFLSEMLYQGNSLLRAIHYPKDPPSNQVWAAAHTDINFFTILPRATADGLQLEHKGEWITVRVPEHAFIVNGGDMLTHLSNGEFKQAPHRVMALGEAYERYSMVMFMHPRSKCDLTPRSSTIARTGGVRKFAACTAWELLMERIADLGIASNFMLEQLGRSGLLEKQIELGNSSEDAMVAVHKAGYASRDIELELEKRGILQTRTN